MNMYQKIAFGTVALLAFAFGVVWAAELNGLGTVVVLAFIVALLTLAVTWKLIISIIQLISTVMAAAGHLIGIIGDEIVDWCKGRKAWLSGLGTAAAVPGWDSFELTHTEPADDLEVPSFVRDAMEHQNA